MNPDCRDELGEQWLGAINQGGLASALEAVYADAAAAIAEPRPGVLGLGGGAATSRSMGIGCM